MAKNQNTKAVAKAAGNSQATELPFEVVKSTKVHLTRTGLVYDEKQTVTIAEWQETGKEIVSMGQLSTFALGDWMNYGMGKFPKDYEKAVEVTGMKVGTLRNIASTCKAFPPDKRRPLLSFEHHRLVRPMLEERAAEAAAILDRAEKEGLTAAAVNALVPRTPRNVTPKKADAVNSEFLTKCAELIGYIEGAQECAAPVGGFFKSWGSTTDMRSKMGELAMCLQNYEEAFAEWDTREKAKPAPAEVPAAPVKKSK